MSLIGRKDIRNRSGVIVLFTCMHALVVLLYMPSFNTDIRLVDETDNSDDGDTCPIGSSDFVSHVE